MPGRYGATVRQRIPVEFIESDFEIGFSLVDLTELFPSDAARLLADAEGVYADIETRMGRLANGDSKSFEALVGELRRAIDQAKMRASLTDSRT